MTWHDIARLKNPWRMKKDLDDNRRKMECNAACVKMKAGTRGKNVRTNQFDKPHENARCDVGRLVP